MQRYVVYCFHVLQNEKRGFKWNNYFGIHCVNCVLIRVTLIRIQSECEKIWTKITTNTDTFHEVLVLTLTRFILPKKTQGKAL